MTISRISVAKTFGILLAGLTACVHPTSRPLAHEQTRVMIAATPEAVAREIFATFEAANYEHMNRLMPGNAGGRSWATIREVLPGKIRLAAEANGGGREYVFEYAAVQGGISVTAHDMTLYSLSGGYRAEAGNTQAGGRERFFRDYLLSVKAKVEGR